MVPNPKSSFAMALGNLLSFIVATPAVICIMVVLAAALIVADTFVGIVAAWALKELRSKHMRERMFAKLLQYYSLMILGMFGTIIAKYLGITDVLSPWGIHISPWLFVFVALWHISLTEVTSIGENFSRLQVHGGVNMGILDSLIRAMAPHFDLRRGGSTVVSNTMVVSEDAEEPVIQHTEITKTPGRPAPTPTKTD